MAPLSGERETIEIPREYAPFVNDMADFVRGGGLRTPQGQAEFEGRFGPMSYYGPRGPHPSGYMDLAAAQRIAQAGGDPRPYIGPAGRRELDRLMKFNQPAESDIHVDAILTEISIAYRNLMLIGDQVFPRVPVTKPSDKYFIFDKGGWNRDEGTAIVRGLSAPSARGGYTVSTGTYLVERYSFETLIDDDQYDAADSPINLDTLGTEYCTNKIDLRLEKIVNALLFTNANWTNTQSITSGNRWDASSSGGNYTGGNPFADFKTARLNVLLGSRQRANTLVVGVEVMEILMLHTAFLDRIKYGGTNQNPAMVTAAMLAELLSLDRVLVGMGVENTAQEQLPDVETAAYIWGKKAWVGYVAPTPAREAPSAGYVFTKGRRVDRYREERVSSDVIRCQESFDVKQTSDLSGDLIDTPVG